MSYNSQISPSSQVEGVGAQFDSSDGSFSGDENSNGSLPCLNSNNSIGAFIKDLSKVLSEPNGGNFLTPYHRRQAYALSENVTKFCTLNGIEKVGFLTLTFKDFVLDYKEAQRRFNSLSTNYLRKTFPEYMLVKERQLQRGGAWHYHLLVACNADIRTGLDFEKVFPKTGRGDYRSASPYLRSLWYDLRMAMERYGFGRSELAPIKSTEDGIGKYIGKYIQHNAFNRFVTVFEDKGVRIVSYSNNWPRTSMAFSWNTPGGKEWRRKVKRFATEYVGVKRYEELSLKLGHRWAYFFADVIQDIDSILEAREKRKSDYGGNYRLCDGQLVNKATGQVVVESLA